MIKRGFVYSSAIFQIMLMISMSFAIALFINNTFVSGQSNPPTTAVAKAHGLRKVPLTDGGEVESTKPSTLSEGISKIYKGKGFGLEGVPGSLLAGVAWAATAYMVVKLIGPMLGLDEGMQKALEASVSAE